MKGIVFTEFLDFVEQLHGPDVVDTVIQAAALPNGGAYTSVGTYDHREMLSLVKITSDHTGLQQSQITSTFGIHLADSLMHCYGFIYKESNNLFDFIALVDRYIHVEVRKLYPDAELPSFEVSYQGAGEIRLRYRSQRKMHDLAHGLILGSARFYETPVSVDLSLGVDAKGDFADFRITALPPNRAAPS
jgi:hypothetical protein